MGMLDLTLWLDSDCDVCASRRYNREGRRGAFDAYAKRFRDEVWHHHELYRGEQLANVPNVLRLSTALQPQELVTQAVEHCRATLKSDSEHVEPEVEEPVAVASISALKEQISVAKDVCIIS